MFGGRRAFPKELCPSGIRKIASFPPSSGSPYFLSKESQRFWPTPMQTLRFKRNKNWVGEWERIDGFWGMKWHLNIFLTFNYVEIAEYLIKATGHLYLVKSAFPEDLGCAAGLERGRGSVLHLALWTMLTGLPPIATPPSCDPRLTHPPIKTFFTPALCW